MYGTPGWGDLYCERLTSEELILVAAPALLAQKTVPLTPADISSLPLLSDEFDPAWEKWSASNGIGPGDLPDPVIRFGDSAVLIAAAIDGQGAALVRRLLVEDDVQAGRLIRLDSSATPSERSLYFVCRKGEEDRVPVRMFRNWLMSLGLQ